VPKLVLLFIASNNVNRLCCKTPSVAKVRLVPQHLCGYSWDTWVECRTKYYSSGRIPKKHDAFFSQVTDLRVSPVARSVRDPLRSSLVDGSISSDKGVRWVESLHSSLHSFPGGAKLCCLEESKKGAPKSGFEPESEPREGLFSLFNWF
jgi:hypothetical protein